jgi:hypothetical protein
MVTAAQIKVNEGGCLDWTHPISVTSSARLIGGVCHNGGARGMLRCLSLRLASDGLAQSRDCPRASIIS